MPTPKALEYFLAVVSRPSSSSHTDGSILSCPSSKRAKSPLSSEYIRQAPTFILWMPSVSFDSLNSCYVVRVIRKRDFNPLPFFPNLYHFLSLPYDKVTNELFIFPISLLHYSQFAIRNAKNIFLRSKGMLGFQKGINLIFSVLKNERWVRGEFHLLKIQQLKSQKENHRQPLCPEWEHNNLPTCHVGIYQGQCFHTLFYIFLLLHIFHHHIYLVLK